MFKFLRNLFAKKTVEADPDGIVRERWAAEFPNRDRARFEELEEDRYDAALSPDGLSLSIRDRDLFAWSEAPEAAYDDFVLRASVRFDEDNGRSAAGFIVRKTGDRDFAYVLVSNAGYVRVDAVFNGEPHPVVAWTETPAPVGPDFELVVVARGSRYLVFVDGLWACEAEDETVRSGSIAFAGQNYGERDEATFFLESLVVESRPVDVEALYFRYGQAMPVDPAQRVRLAASYFASGNPLAAAIELRKAERDAPPDAETSFLRAECALALGLHDEAEEALAACLRAEPAHARALEERANLHYLRGRFLELRDELEADPGRVRSSPRLSNLLGHAWSNLGRHDAAADWYAKAAALEPDMPIFALNEARSRELAGDPSGAAAAFRAAARGFYDQEDFQDLAECLERLEELEPDDPGTKAVRAKVAFSEGRRDEAVAIIEGLFASGYRDPSLSYLHGIALSGRGRRTDALARFREAVEGDPDEQLYRFRLAEALFLSGEDPAAELSKALELKPDDGWTRNLQGQVLMASGDLDGAKSAIESARRALPDEPAPAINLSEVLSRLGRVEDALAELDEFPDDPACVNQCGNVLAAAGRFEEAMADYERAVRLAKDLVPPADEADYLANFAETCIRLERWTDAEEALARAYELSPNAAVLRLLGDVAALYGEYVRAETAYRSAIDLDPKDAAAREALARNYLTRRLYDKAGQVGKELSALDPERGARFETDLLDATTDKLSCDSCAREWRVPKVLPPQNSNSIMAMPPDESPAGACPSCGKVFCIACRKDALVDDRFTCPDCQIPLKLSDDRLRWLVRDFLKRAAEA